MSDLPRESDDRLYRTELIHAGDDRPDQRAGWSLYIDNNLIGHTAEDLSAQAAKAWADSRIGEGMVWEVGHPDGWYWVASPAQAGVRR